MRYLKLTLGVLVVCGGFLLFKIFTGGTLSKPKPKPGDDSKPNINRPDTTGDDAAAQAANSGYVDPLWVLYQDYVKAQRSYLLGSMALVSRKRKDLEKVAKIRLQAEILELNLRSKQLKYLLEHKPERVKRDHGLRRFVQVDWSESDQLDLEVEDPQTAILKKNLASAKEQFYQFEEWDDLQNYVQDELSKTEEHKQLVARRDEVFDRVTAALGDDKSQELADSIIPAEAIAKVLPANQGRFSGLAVRDENGRVYFVVSGEMTEIRYLDAHEVEAYQKIEGAKDPGHVFWTRPKGSDRVELAGLKKTDEGDELLIVFNNEVPYHSGETAWTRSRAFYSIGITKTDRPPELISIADDVIALVIEKCRQ